MSTRDNPFDLPRNEDVTEIDLGSHRLASVKVTDQHRAGLADMAMSMHLGEKCKYCLREYKTLTDLEDAVWVGDHEYGRLACESCWKANGPQP
jgi:hypothetical protein